MCRKLKKARVTLLSIMLNVQDFARGTDNFFFSKTHITGKVLLHSSMR